MVREVFHPLDDATTDALRDALHGAVGQIGDELLPGDATILGSLAVILYRDPQAGPYRLGMIAVGDEHDAAIVDLVPLLRDAVSNVCKAWGHDSTDETPIVMGGRSG